jgi:hypothetical protein
MFYSHSLLAKKGPLARVWLAAHWEKKLTRASIQQTDIKKAAGACSGENGRARNRVAPAGAPFPGAARPSRIRIVSNIPRAPCPHALSADEIRKPAQPLALRLSGQLLLGITRIYHKKVTLLYEDGQSALKKLSEFFKPENLDVNEAGAGDAAAVTLAEPAWAGAEDERALDGNDAFVDADVPDHFGGDENELYVGMPLGKAAKTRGKSGQGLALESTMADDFAPRTARGRLSDVEQLRRAETTPGGGISARLPASAGLTGTTTDDEGRSGITGSDTGDSLRRSRRSKPEEAEAAAARRTARASLLEETDEYGMGEAMGLEELGGGAGGEMDMGLEGGDYGMPDVDYDLGGGAQGTMAAQPSDSDIAAALKKRPAAALNASGVDAKSGGLKKKKEEGKEGRTARGKEKASDARVMLSGETIKSWLADTSAITKPRLSGNMRSAAVFMRVEDECDRKRLAFAAGAKGCQSVAINTAMELVARLDLLQLSPAVWHLVNRGGRIVYDKDPKVNALAEEMAARLGTTKAAHAAAKARGLVGLRDLNGIGDTTEDGDLCTPCPPRINVAARVGNFSRSMNTLVGPQLAKILADHTLSRAKYPPSARAVAAEAAAAEAEEARAAAAAGEGELDLNADAGDYGVPDIDYNLGGEERAEMEWNERDGEDGTPGRASEASGAGKSAERVSVLQKYKDVAPPPSAATAMEEEEEEAADDAMAGSDGLPSPGAEVDPHKMHEATVRALKSLAGAMTGPVGGEEGSKAGKKRKSREGALAAYPDGDLSSTNAGAGSGADPLSLKTLLEGANRRTAASTFYQLLILKSMDLIAVAQAAPCGDITIARTVRAATGRCTAPALYRLRLTPPVPPSLAQDRFAPALEVHSSP